MQYQITHADLSLVLALERGRSLAKAAELLKVDVSTVFRSIRRLESALGTALFVKSRKGYLPTDTAQALAEQAERAEQALDAARIALTSGEQVVSGTVRLTCTEAVMHSLLLPALAGRRDGRVHLRARGGLGRRPGRVRGLGERDGGQPHHCRQQELA